MHTNKAVLDTHTLIWLVEGEKLSQKTINNINKYSNNNELYISAISLWEIAHNTNARRIKLSKPCLSWLQELTSQPGIRIANVTSEIAVESTLLPNGFHGDPADRLIVATARILGATLFTRDGLILDLPSDYLKCEEV
jgi:PIN domain nuclease of toxin-antitoxin system